MEVREAGSGRNSEPVVAGTIRVRAGDDLSAVVHADASGGPTLSTFSNVIQRLPAGDARLVVRHTAASRPVGVLLDGRMLDGRVRPGNEKARELRSGRHRIAVTRVGTNQPLVPPTDVEFDEGTATVLYLIGSAPDDSLGWIAQTVRDVSGAPSGVPSGDSGLAAPRPLADLLSGLAVPSALLAALGAAFVLRRRRHPASA